MKEPLPWGGRKCSRPLVGKRLRLGDPLGSKVFQRRCPDKLHSCPRPNRRSDQGVSRCSLSIFDTGKSPRGNTPAKLQDQAGSTHLRPGGEDLIMAADRDRIIRSCSDLAPGVEIEAWHHGRLIHRGRVTQVVPSMSMFWIIDARNGTRMLLDADALEVVSLDGPAPEPGS
jgi:hypothetical protein